MSRRGVPGLVSMAHVQASKRGEKRSRRSGPLFSVFLRRQKGLKKMILQGLVLSGDVLESTFYDQSTGQPKPGYSVKLTVLDAETDEKYECQVSEGFPSLDHLKELKQQGQPLEVLQQVAEQLRTELPPKMTPLA